MAEGKGRVQVGWSKHWSEASLDQAKASAGQASATRETVVKYWSNTGPRPPWTRRRPTLVKYWSNTGQKLLLTVTTDHQPSTLLVACEYWSDKVHFGYRSNHHRQIKFSSTVIFKQWSNNGQIVVNFLRDNARSPIITDTAIAPMR